MKPKKEKSKKVYRNPVYVAMEWQAMLDSGECESRAELARKLGVSRARVTQVLNLLNLNHTLIRKITELGDPLGSPVMTERKLRKVTGLLLERQGKEVDKIIRLVELKRQ